MIERTAQLQATNVKLQVAAEAKDLFLANMSHELRTPLNGIIGYAEFLVDGKPGTINPKQKDCLEEILNSGKHLLQLISDILDLAKVGAGKIESQDCVLHAAPLSHGAGLYGLPHVAKGAVSVVPQSGGVDGDEIAALLGRWPGMSFFAAPTMVRRLAGDWAIVGADLSHLKTIIYGGAPMYLADLEDALAVFGPRLAQIYGQGEAPMTITGLSQADHADRNHPRWRDHMQSVGVPGTDVEVRVVDDGRELPAGEIGEVVVRGDVVMAGDWTY